jgi:hypothetical protein
MRIRRRPTPLSAWLRERPWDPPDVPESVASVPMMISDQEQTLLYRLAAEQYDGKGAIIDAGCFLGGSTAAFVDGLRANRRKLPQRPVHTYDLFIPDWGVKGPYQPAEDEIPDGDSTLPRFRDLMGDRLEQIHVHQGDIRDEKWSGDAVSILFIDLAKKWSINDHVNREFFPSLVPHKSVVIQQDYMTEWVPWIHIGMELLGDAFEFIAWAPHASAIFVPTRTIRRDEIPASLREELSDDEKMELFGRAAGRFEHMERGILELSRGVLLAELGDPASGLRHVEQTLADYGEYERVAMAGATVAAVLSDPEKSPYRALRPGKS